MVVKLDICDDITILTFMIFYEQFNLDLNYLLFSRKPKNMFRKKNIVCQHFQLI